MRARARYARSLAYRQPVFTFLRLSAVICVIIGDLDAHRRARARARAKEMIILDPSASRHSDVALFQHGMIIAARTF